MCNRKFLILFVFFVLTGNAAGQDVTHEAVVSPSGVVISEVNNQTIVEDVMTPFFYVMGIGTSVVHATTTLDASGEKLGHIGYFTTPDGLSRSITHICWATDDVTTGGDLIVQLESVDTSGLYSGIIATGASKTETITTSHDYTWWESELTTPYTMSSGSHLAATFELSGTGNMKIPKKHISLGSTYSNGGSWTTEALGGAAQARTAYSGNVALKTSLGEYLYPLTSPPVQRIYYTSISTSTTPRYIGNKIIVGNKAIVKGFYIPRLEMDYDITIRIVDSRGTTLKADDGTTDMSKAQLSTYRNDLGGITGSIDEFQKSKTLQPGVPYYLIFSPDTTFNTSIYRAISNTAGLKRQTHNLLDGWELTYVSSPSTVSFTEDDTAVAAIRPVFSHIEFPRFTQTLR